MGYYGREGSPCKYKHSVSASHSISNYNCHKIKKIEISHCILFLQLSSMGDPQCDVRKIVGAFDARILPYRGHGQQYQTSSISGMRRSIIIEHVINSYYSFSKL